ncbi:phytanoyl-CoA dioxygenase family protein [Tengunoibacter tsumagoiensis]|uniref:SnoK n=1 Tax=Tengunoibacter tsumagoiensis TaxID=2014871 RepID=A0A402A7C3_9CHLR|nr:phytanoyl-CoA dioxygenase family protein [Tengunoibacter tsumagoiensis]GCE14945.1 SnoK [Tengunoibacter tsumagoiensis]
MPVLTLEQRQFFADNGYLVIHNLFDLELINQIKEAIFSIFNGQHTGIRHRSEIQRPDGTVLTNIQQLYRAHPVLSQFIKHPYMGSIASALMDDTPEVRLWHDTLIYKEKLEGGAVPWHQDYYLLQHVAPADIVTGWIALSKSNEESGCLYVVPGSHKWGLMPSHALNNIGPDSERFLKRSVHEALRPLIVKQPLVLEPGDVSFHHCLTIHGSYQNRSDYPRLGYIQHYFPAHLRRVAVSGLDYAQAYEVTVPTGELVRGDAFPLVWSATPNENHTDTDILC